MEQSKLNFSKTITASGVNLWTLNLPYSGSVSVGVLVKTGTRDEIWPKEAGIAHALEHMHFQGTKNFPTSQEVSGYIEEVGGTVNAWTWKEMTFHWLKVPAFYSERAVHLLSEQLKESIIPKEKIPIEMKNIVQEIRRKNDNPRDLIWVISDEFIYQGHPLAKATLGFEESVIAFTRDDFLRFKGRYYDPSNYVFITVGKITQEEALNLFNKYFSEKPSVNPNIYSPQKLKEAKNHWFVKNKDIEQLHLFISTVTGKAQEKDALYLDFFEDMISGGMSFPLFQEVRDKLGLCYEIWAYNTKWSDLGKFDIYIGTDPKRYKEAIDAALGVIENHKADENLLEKVKNLKIGKITLLYEDTAMIINQAAQDIAFTGEPKDYNQIIKEIEEVNIDNIKGGVEKYLKPDSIFFTLIAPQNFSL